MGGNPETETGEQKKPRIDLSVAQVAGSAVAAIAAAVLASKLGVYGTIIGAGVVSVVATSGGTIFQHLFRRTGEQIREVTVQAKPKARQVPARDEPVPAYADEFGEATTHGTRVRGWKRSAIPAALVFAVAMGGITAYELASGGDLSGGRGSTVGNVLRGGGGEQGQKQTPASDTPSEDRPGSVKDGGESPDKGTGPGTGTGTDPDAGTDQGTGSPDPAKTPPTTDGGSTGEATPTPTPTPTPTLTGGDSGETESGDTTGSGGDATDGGSTATP